MDKLIRYTGHALTALRERGISETWIEQTVRAPQWIEPDPEDPEVMRYFRAIPERDGRFLRVALVESPDALRIITAFFDRGARPK